MTDTEGNVGSFSDPSQAARLRDLLNGLIDDRVRAIIPTRMTGMVLDIYQGGPTFNSDITVNSTIIPRTQDNPERPYVARIRLDDKFEGGVIEARIDPNLIPIFRKADFFDEDNPAGSGTMVDRAGRYVTVEVTGDGSALVDDTYPSLIGTTLQAPQVAPRVALEGSAAGWRVVELIRGVLAIQTNPATLMLGPDYARFDTNTLTWGGTIAFARGSEIKAYEIYPEAPIVTYGSEALVVGSDEPVEIVLGQRSGSMYLNFSATDGVPVLVWVEADSDTPIPPEWYLVFARINNGDLSSKLVFSSLTDFRSPSAPDNFSVTGVKSGYEKVNMTASWDAVTEGTNGDLIQVSGYEVWGYINDEDWRRIASTSETAVTGLSFDSGSAWHFRVRAIGSNGIPGVFSNAESITFPDEPLEVSTKKTYWSDEKPTTANEDDELFKDDGNGGFSHWVWQSGAWINVPFNGTAIANAAIGNAQIKDLDVEKLVGTSLRADVVLATGSIKTADLGSRTVIDQGGLHIYQGEDLVFNAPTVGRASFNGGVDAQTLNITGSSSFKAGSDNYIEKSASLKMAAGIKAPISAGIISNVYEKIVKLVDEDGAPFVPQHVFWDGSSFWSIVNGSAPLLGEYFTNLHQHDIDTGEVIYTKKFSSPASKSGYYGSFVIAGGYFYGIYNTNIDRWTVGGILSLPGTFTAASKSNPFAPTIGWDSVNSELVVGYLRSDKKEAFIRINPGTLATVATVINGTANTSASVRGPIAINSGYLGTHGYMRASDLIVRACTDSGVDMSDSVYTPATSDSRGLGYDTVGSYTGWWTASPDGSIYKYAGPWWSGSQSRTNYCAYTYYDSVGTTHETPPSPSQVFVHSKGAVIQCTVSNWESNTSEADSVDKLRFYLGTASNLLYRQVESAVNTVKFYSLTLTGGNFPPSTNNFPDSNPGSILSNDGNMIIDGAGKVQVVPSKFRGYPIKWIGYATPTSGSSIPLTSDVYKSIKVNNRRDYTGEWEPTWADDCFQTNFKAWVKIVWQATFDSTSTTGNRGAFLYKNPTGTQNSSTSQPAGASILRWSKVYPNMDYTTCVCEWEGIVEATDKIMTVVRTSSDTNLNTDSYRTELSITIERIID